MPHYVLPKVDMINFALYQTRLPGKSDKRNIYASSSASKPPMMNEQRTEYNINLPDTAIFSPESTMTFPFLYKFQDKIEMVYFCHFSLNYCY